MSTRIILMGVAGCGKSSVGEAISARTGIAYRDGDDLHPAANVEKMRSGIPLTDEDRWPWLDQVGRELADKAPIIIGCSALKRIYRDRIRALAGGPVTFVHLAGSRDLIAGRMAQRTGHYMPLSLLDSQFAALELPQPDEGALTADICQPLDALVDGIVKGLNLEEIKA
ncbi:gluconokinase [Pannonibacter indicus]|uniref:Gluconokinase n=1 Tax=Pannonibacter indicus TaxID=466044 RepID=A0A0K6HNF7_9HYPH|nr:gluconokinase [Pannonibacter indicus]CUA92414.1 gluconate kinase, SKI family [Pannonibacter indicus]